MATNEEYDKISNYKLKGMNSSGQSGYEYIQHRGRSPSLKVEHKPDYLVLKEKRPESSQDKRARENDLESKEFNFLFVPKANSHIVSPNTDWKQKL